jgi:hypothetical protein
VFELQNEFGITVGLDWLFNIFNGFVK